ncbi:MAG: hypothetical protein PW735_01155 [Acidobacteriaceae bacterium]|nr:hypothetical protein [Acidobacteriaceae bacterium]
MKNARYVLAAALILAPAIASAHPIIAAHPQTISVHDRTPKPHMHTISAHR